MNKIPSKVEMREASHVLGEMAASRLFSVIHERLEELRDRYGLTQTDLAHRLGVSEQVVSHWLAEPRNMTVRSAGRLLAALEAHLLFELDRFEDIGRGNAVATQTASQVTSISVDGRALVSRIDTVSSPAPGPSVAQAAAKQAVVEFSDA